MTRARTFHPVIAAAAALVIVLGAPAPASADHGRYSEHHGRHGRESAHAWTPPLPPLPPRPRWLPVPRPFPIPTTIHLSRQALYSPYRAGRVFYAPRGRYLDVYYFPVALGARIVWEPHYYCDGRLFLSFTAGAPRFNLRIGF